MKELKEGWCSSTANLNKIIISPSNSQFKIQDNKYLIGKSDPNKEEFDNLLFVYKDIKEISIPSNIKIISSYAFEYCFYLTKVEIPTNSNLHTIEKCAFSNTILQEIFIPMSVLTICENAFSYSNDLTKIEIPPNSNLQKIEKYAFLDTNISEFFIPSNVSEICKDAFKNCYNLQIIEISEESKLDSFPLPAFDEYLDIIIMIPGSLEKLISSLN